MVDRPSTARPLWQRKSRRNYNRRTDVGASVGGLVRREAFGALVIGLVDNFLRPILVGKDTKMPDYVVLISTLGGIATFGLNGFVIGPVIAAMFIAAWDIFSASRQSVEKDGTIR